MNHHSIQPVCDVNIPQWDEGLEVIPGTGRKDGKSPGMFRVVKFMPDLHSSVYFNLNFLEKIVWNPYMLSTYSPGPFPTCVYKLHQKYVFAVNRHQAPFF
jgi:hypothetical protein